MKQVIESSNAPAALGPYSQAVVVNNMVYTSGQLGLIPESGEFAGETAVEQAEQSLKNIQAVLAEAGTSMDNVVKTMIFLDDLNDFAAVNEVYATFFSQPYPARSCVEAAALPKAAKIEIEVIATV